MSGMARGAGLGNGSELPVVVQFEIEAARVAPRGIQAHYDLKLARRRLKPQDARRIKARRAA